MKAWLHQTIRAINEKTAKQFILSKHWIKYVLYVIQKYSQLVVINSLFITETRDFIHYKHSSLCLHSFNQTYINCYPLVHNIFQKTWPRKHIKLYKKLSFIANKKWASFLHQKSVKTIPLNKTLKIPQKLIHIDWHRYTYIHDIKLYLSCAKTILKNAFTYKLYPGPVKHKPWDQ